MFISECTAHCIAISCTSLIGTSDFNIYPVSLSRLSLNLYILVIYMYIYIRFMFEFLVYAFTSNHAACFICHYN